MIPRNSGSEPISVTRTASNATSGPGPTYSEPGRHLSKPCNTSLRLPQLGPWKFHRKTTYAAKTRRSSSRSKHVCEDTLRSAHPPLPSSKARPAIPRGTASRRHLLRQENCRRGRSKCLTTRRRITVALV